MEKDALEKVIRKEINNFPLDYRCHEGARMFAGKLRSLGMSIDVKDGGVIYDTAYFLNYFEDFFPPSFFEDLSDEEREEIAKELKSGEEKSKLSVLHSWCEFRDDSNNTIVVDWHANLGLPQNSSIENFLIIDDKNNLPHKYIPLGIAIGKWIIFKTFPPHAIKLRI